MYKPEKVLFLAAHPDDELNAAGTLNKFVRQGAKVYYAVFTDCKEDSKELDFEPNVLFEEMRKSLDAIEITTFYLPKKKHIARYLYMERQSILERMVAIDKQVHPDLVIVPNTKDLHQDHITITQEARRAFRHCSIFGYESVRALITSENICFIELDAFNLDAKIAAMLCYKTQVLRIDIGARESLAKVRGSQAGYRFAEAFEVIRLCS